MPLLPPALTATAKAVGKKATRTIAETDVVENSRNRLTAGMETPNSFVNTPTLSNLDEENYVEQSVQNEPPAYEKTYAALVALDEFEATPAYQAALADKAQRSKMGRELREAYRYNALTTKVMGLDMSSMDADAAADELIAERDRLAGIAYSDAELADFIQEEPVSAVRRQSLRGNIQSDRSAESFIQDLVDEMKFANPETGELLELSNLAQVGQQLIVDQPFLDAAGAARSTFPELYESGDLADWMDKGDTITTAMQHIKSVAVDNPSQAREMFKAYATELFSRRGTTGALRNNFDYAAMMDHVAQNIDLQSAGERTLFSAIALMEALGVAQIGKAGVSALSKLGIRLGMGKAAHAVIKKGTKRQLLNLVRKSAGEDPAKIVTDGLKTDPGAVIGDVVAPKFRGESFDPGKQYLPEGVMDASDEVADRLAQEVADAPAGFKVNDVVVTHRDDGSIIAEGLIGAQGGTAPFASRKGAERVAEKVGGEVVAEGDGFMVRRSSETEAVESVSRLTDSITSTNQLRQVVGRNTYMSGAASRLLTQLSAEAAKEGKRLLDTLRPYAELDKAGQEKVGSVLQEIDLLDGKSVLDRDALLGRGLSDSEADGYLAIQAAAKRNLAVSRVRVGAKLRSQGVAQIKIAGNDSFSMVRKADGPGDAKTVLDQAGRVVPVEELPEDAVLWRIMDRADAEGGHTLVAVRNNEGIERLSDEVAVPSRGDYVPLYHSAPYFIDEIIEVSVNGVTKKVPVTRYSSGSSSEAAKDLEALKAEFPDKEWAEAPRAARELQDPNLVDSDIAELIAENQAYRSRSRGTPLLRKDGGLAVDEDINTRIGRMLARTKDSVGIGRYVDFLEMQLKRDYGIGSIGRSDTDTLTKGLNLAEEADLAKAQQLIRHAQNLRGLGILDSSKVVDNIRRHLTDYVLNTEAKLPAAVRNQTVSRQLRGLSEQTAVGALKQSVAAAYIMTNIFRSLPMQMTMIPTYVGAKGGVKYAASGGLGRDIIGLNYALAAGPRSAVKKLSQLGWKPSEARQFVKGYMDSGLVEMVDEHIFHMGRSLTSGIVKKGVAGKGIDTLKKYGFDMGVKVDKSATYAISYNRFKELNGRFPRTAKERTEVLDFAEKLSMNMNNSDTLLTQNGIASTYFQFKAHMFKAGARFWGLEAGFEKGEIMRMRLASLAAFGAAGIGVGDLFFDIFGSPDSYESGPVREAVKAAQQGYVGLGFNKLLQLVAADDPVDLALSTEFGPMNASFDLPKFIANLLLLSEKGSLEEALGSAPAVVSFAGSLYDVYKETSNLLGWVSPLEDPKAYALAAAEVAQVFPIVNNTVKAYIALSNEGRVESLRTGKTTDDFGNPFVAATGILLGLDSTDKETLNLVKQDLYGKYNPEELDAGLEAEAAAKARQLVALLDSQADGSIHTERGWELWKKQQQWMATAIPDAGTRRKYMSALGSELRRLERQNGKTAAESLADYVQYKFSEEENKLDVVQLLESTGNPTLVKRAALLRRTMEVTELFKEDQ